MLSLRDVEKIRDLVENYQLSGNPFHKAAIYFEYGIEGAIFLKDFSVAATMIKKNPELINSEIVRKEITRQEIFKMLVNDFNSSKEKIDKSSSDTTALEMIIDICKEIKPTKNTRELDISFVFDIYRLYAKCPFYDDYDFLTEIAFNGFMSTVEFVDNLFYKETLHTAVFELCQTMINMAPYTDVYLDVLLSVIHIYVRLYYGDDIVDKGERKLLKDEIIDSICECTTTVDSHTILKTIMQLKTMERTAKYYIEKFDYMLPENVYYESAQIDALNKLYGFIKEKVKEEYEDIKYDDIEILDVVQELSHEDGIRRIAVYSYINDNIIDFNVEGFYDLKEEIYLIDLIRNDINDDTTEDIVC
ncbi:MAG: hypothetical protein ACOCRK_02000 [bacterium]